MIAYHLLRRGEYYRDLGATYFDQRDRQAVERRLIKRLETLGNTVELQPSTEQREEIGREAARRAAEFDLAKKRLPLTWQPGQSVPRDRGPSG